MNSADILHEVVFPALDDFKDVYDVAIEKAPDSMLWGEGTVLTSFDLVNLIISLERTIKERFGKNIVLADASAFSGEKSPFRTLASLASYIEEKISQ